jgi:hypothetical protein
MQHNTFGGRGNRACSVGPFRWVGRIDSGVRQTGERMRTLVRHFLGQSRDIRGPRWMADNAEVLGFYQPGSNRRLGGFDCDDINGPLETGPIPDCNIVLPGVVTLSRHRGLEYELKGVDLERGHRALTRRQNPVEGLKGTPISVSTYRSDCCRSSSRAAMLPTSSIVSPCSTLTPPSCPMCRPKYLVPTC